MQQNICTRLDKDNDSWSEYGSTPQNMVGSMNVLSPSEK